jgi:ankyrin repeat domain-containing protein 50
MSKKFNLALGFFLLLSQTALSDSSLNSRFISASSAGDLNLVKALLSQGAEINGKDIIGETALHWSALECHLDVVEFLTTQPGIQKNQRDTSGDVPVGLAAASGCLDAVKFLARQTDLNATNHTGESPLFLSASMGRTEVAKFLSQQPNVNINAADISNITPLWIASAGGADEYIEIVKSLVSNHADLEISGGYYKNTALSEASATGHLEIVKFLVSVGANRNAKDSSGLTPGEVACTRWAGLPSDDGGGPCPQDEILSALTKNL